MRHPLLSVGAALLLAAVAACEDPPTVLEAPKVVAVRVESPAPSLEVGQQLQLSATAMDESGKPVPLAMQWTSSDTTVARVTSSGQVTGRAPGRSTIRVEAAGVGDSVSLTVVRAVAAVSLSPAPERLLVGDTAQLVATLRDDAGQVLRGRTVAWSSSDTAVVRVDSTGLVRARGAGSARVVASSGRAADTARVEVVAVGREVSGVLSGVTRWTKAEGPYLVTGKILIPAGASLTIEPGTRVLVGPGHFLKVEGELVSRGSRDDSVRITSAARRPAAGDWGPIWFAESSVDAVLGENGEHRGGSAVLYTSISDGGPLQLDASSPYIAHNRIRRVRGSPPRDWPNGAVWTCNSGAIIEHNVIEDNPLTGIVVLGGAPQIRRNLIQRNSGGSMGGGIFFANANCAGGTNVPPRALVEDNRIVGNRAALGGGIAIYSGSPLIRYNDIVENSTTAASGTNGGGAALATFSHASPDIVLNEIRGNRSLAADSARSAALLFNAAMPGILERNNITNPTTFEVRLNAGARQDVRAPSNFWNVTAAQLAGRVWDYSDDWELGRLLVEPVLDARIAVAGARSPQP